MHVKGKHNEETDESSAFFANVTTAQDTNGNTCKYIDKQNDAIKIIVETKVDKTRATKWNTQRHQHNGPTYHAPATCNPDTGFNSAGVAISIAKGIDHVVHDLDHEGHARHDIKVS